MYFLDSKEKQEVLWVVLLQAMVESLREVGIEMLLRVGCRDGAAADRRLWV